MLSSEFTINCTEGFHLRPAQVFMETVTPVESTVIIRTAGDEEADAKSLLGLMSLGLEQGDRVTVEVDGPDEEAVMAKVTELFDSNFGE